MGRIVRILVLWADTDTIVPMSAPVRMEVIAPIRTVSANVNRDGQVFSVSRRVAQDSMAKVVRSSAIVGTAVPATTLPVSKTFLLQCSQSQREVNYFCFRILFVQCWVPERNM